MINLKVADYCQSCPDFKPSVEKEHVEAVGTSYYMCDTTIKCENVKRCAKMIEWLKKQGSINTEPEDVNVEDILTRADAIIEEQHNIYDPLSSVYMIVKSRSQEPLTNNERAMVARMIFNQHERQGIHLVKFYDRNGFVERVIK